MKDLQSLTSLDIRLKQYTLNAGVVKSGIALLHQ